MGEYFSLPFAMVDFDHARPAEQVFGVESICAHKVRFGEDTAHHIFAP
jgi:hypothetical protein